MSALRKNVAGQHIGFVLTNSTTGAPVTAGGAGNVVIDGGAQAACAGTFTHKGSGQWDYAPTQAETNGASIGFAFTGTGALQVGVQCFTIGYDPTQAQVPANTTQLAGQAVTAGAGVTFPSSVASPTNITAATGITVSTNNDKSGYSLTQAFPTNFSSLGITVGGAVTAGTVSDKTGYSLTSGYNFAQGTVQMAESYAANGVPPTPIQAIYAIHQMLMDFSITGTTVTVKQLDNATGAFTATLDSASAPTSIHR